MDKEIDPEVLADLQLRDSTARDRTRKGEPARWTAPVIAEQWPCRTCGVGVGVTSEAREYADAANRVLSAQGQDPIDTQGVMFCEACRARHRSTGVARRKREMAALADLIAKLKASRSPGQELELIKQIGIWGHPDVHGLVESIIARRNGTRSKPKGET